MENRLIIFYDGTCGLCDRVVQFVLKRDKGKQFSFASLQSAFARRVLGEGLATDSFVYFENNKAFYRSEGALKTLRKLGFPWSLFYGFILIPSFMRDAVYNVVARNRYKWYGRFEACKIPTAEEKARFIE